MAASDWQMTPDCGEGAEQQRHRGPGGGSDRFRLQDEAYTFPYHHIPEVDGGGAISIHRALVHSLEYLTYMTRVCERVLAAKPQSLLDVGCGDGRLLRMLAGLGVRRVGVDPSSRAIAFARAFNPDADFIVGSAADVQGRFDAVTCVETLEHIPDDQLAAFVAALHQRLQPSGILILSVPTAVRSVQRKHFRHYTLELLQDNLAPSFRLESHEYVFRCGVLVNVLRRFLANRWFLLQSSTLRRWIWAVHCRWSFAAIPANGAHLVATCRSCVYQ